MKKSVVIRCVMGCIAIWLSICSCGQIDTISGEEAPMEPVTEKQPPTIEEKIAEIESSLQPALSEEEINALEVKKNPFPTMNVPTDVQKIEDTYFIVDCYNNQVIYSEDIQAPLSEWNVMCDIMNAGHTIAGNGEVYLIDDTENNRVLVYEKRQDKFLLVQILNHVGVRPHYVRYDEPSDAFYVLSSMTGEIYVLKVREHIRDKADIEESANTEGDNVPENEIYVQDIKRFEELSTTYCRSFTILGDKILLPASNGLILEASFPACKVSAVYQTPKEVAGLVQIYEIDDSYYFTVSTDGGGNQDYATLIVTKSLLELEKGNYEDLYDVLEPERGSVGTPYNISAFDEHYYLVEHRHGHGVFQFDVSDGGLENVEIIH